MTTVRALAGLSLLTPALAHSIPAAPAFPTAAAKASAAADCARTSKAANEQGLPGSQQGLQASVADQQACLRAARRFLRSRRVQSAWPCQRNDADQMLQMNQRFPGA